MLFTKFLFILALLAFAICAILFSWLYLPFGKLRDTHVYSTAQLALGSGVGLLGTWTSELESPGHIPLGAAGSLRLIFQPESPSVGPAGTNNAFESYNVVVEARAEIPSAQSVPSGLLTRVLEPGRLAEFDWRLTPQSEGLLDGRVWLYLRYVPKNGGPDIDRPLSIQPVQIRSVTLAGRNANQVRELALIVFALGTVLALPYLALRSRHRHQSAHVSDEPSG
jgi:hypothetical protein